MFVHGPDVLLDTPEEIKDQLNRSRVGNIAACIYSHWHPDHVMGRRVFESLNWDVRGWPRRNRCTDVYVPERVGRDLRKMLGSWDHLRFLERLGLVSLIEVPEGESIELGGIEIRPFPVAEDYVYAFVFEGDGERLLIAPDELKGWEPPEWVRGADLAILPKGLDEFDPFTGERRIHRDHPILDEEATFEETLDIVRKLEAKRVILTHIEEVDGLTYDDLRKWQSQLDKNLNVSFAFDTMVADVR